MNKFRFYFILSIVASVFFSCTPTTTADVVSVPLRDFSTQSVTDNALIETYLKTHFIEFNDKSVKLTDPDFADKSFTYSKITDEATQVSLMSYLGKETFPKLKVRTFYVSNIEHKMYYLILREGLNDRPSNVDGVFAGYSGELLNGKVFETSLNTEQLYNLDGSSTAGGLSVIRGWSEFFPFLKSGDFNLNSNGTFSFSDFGVGSMFLPSVLGYYANSQVSSNGITIDEYSPLVFTVKLYGVRRYDHDDDGIPSYLEDADADGFMYNSPLFFATSTVNPDDTDGDGFANYLDVDDDGDGVNTKVEIKRPNILVNGFTISNGYYPYNGATVDDPSTPNIDERQGIPSYNTATKSLDYTSTGRLRVHLDKNYLNK